MLMEVLESGQITYISQDRNWKFINLLVYICADGLILSPALIYSGKSEILQNT